MSIPLVGQVGPQVLADGSDALLRQGKTGEAIIQQLHGRYFESMYRGNIYNAANQAAQAVSVALATAYTGLALYNPVGSGKILVPLKLKYALSVAPAAIATLGLIFSIQTAPPTTPTALTVRSTQIGNSSAGVGLAYSAGTITTPVWLQQISDGSTAAALPAPTLLTDLEGLYGILPGGLLAIGALTAVTGLGSITWEEVPF